MKPRQKEDNRSESTKEYDRLLDELYTYRINLAVQLLLLQGPSRAPVVRGIHRDDQRKPLDLYEEIVSKLQPSEREALEKLQTSSELKALGVGLAEIIRLSPLLRKESATQEDVNELKQHVALFNSITSNDFFADPQKVATEMEKLAATIPGKDRSERVHKCARYLVLAVSALAVMGSLCLPLLPGLAVSMAAMDFGKGTWQKIKSTPQTSLFSKSKILADHESALLGLADKFKDKKNVSELQSLGEIKNARSNK